AEGGRDRRTTSSRARPAWATHLCGSVVAHTFNPSTQEAEAGLFYTGEFQDSQGYTEKPCLETNKRKGKTKQKTGLLANLWDIFLTGY
ncbi:hypothetical protein ACQP3D_27065, partial [Escherichia coli]